MKFFILLPFVLLFISACSSSISDPQESKALGDDYFGDTIIDDELINAPPGLSLLNFKGGEFVKSGSTHEVRWLLKPESGNDVGLFSSQIMYSSDSGNTWLQIPGAVRIPALSGYPVSYQWKVPEGNSGNGFMLKIIIKNIAGEEKSTQSESTFTLDNDPPQINAGSLKINGNQQIKKSYFLFDVSFSDSVSPISEICSKNLPKNSTEVITPLDEDSCWVKVGNLGYSENLTLNFLNIPKVIGFIPGDYVFRVWAKDKAGNISNLKSGLGEVGVDKYEFNYLPAKGISVQKIIFANSANPHNPPLSSEQSFSAVNSEVYVHYTLDDIPIETRFLVSTDGGVTYSGDKATQVCTAASGFDNCRKFSYTSNTSFMVKLIFKSNLNMISSALSPAMNIPNFRMIAGNLDNGIGGAAVSAGYKLGYYRGLLMDSRGKFYVNDSSLGLLVIDPDTGAVNVLLKKNEAVNPGYGDGGPVTLASTPAILQLAIDYRDRVLVVEKDRIRRIETDNTINTFIGGGFGAETMNFFPIHGCMRSNNPDLMAISDFSTNPDAYIKNGFVTEAALYRVSSSGYLLLNNIHNQNEKNISNPNFSIKKENIFYESELRQIKFDFDAISTCSGMTPTITPLPNGDIYIAGFHSGELAQGRGSYTMTGYRGAGPNWYAYYTAPKNNKSADIKIIPLKGTGSLNLKSTNDTSNGKGTLFPDYTFENNFLISNPQLQFNYQTNRLLNVHTRSCFKNGSACENFYNSTNYSATTGSSVRDGLQYIPEAWYSSARLVTSRKGDLYSINRGTFGIYKYMPTSNSFVKIVGTGLVGQCQDGTLAIKCSIDPQDLFVDINDNIYFFDRDRLRTVIKKGSDYREWEIYTLFGFAKSSGDYDISKPYSGDSLNARFNSIQSLSLHSFDKEIVVHDSAESLVREFSVDYNNSNKFKISTIAGNTFNPENPTFSGSFSNEVATDVRLNFNNGVFADTDGVIYARAAKNIFAKLNRTGINSNKWEIILGHPTVLAGKKIYNTAGGASCDSGITSPAACDASDRTYVIHGIIPAEGMGNPFLLISNWTWYLYNRQASYKLIKTSVDGADLVRNLSGGDWFTGLVASFPSDGIQITKTNFPGNAPKSQYINIDGNGYIFSLSLDAGEKAVRYFSLNRDVSGRVTSAGKMGTLIDGLNAPVRSFYINYNSLNSLKFTSYICLTDGRLLKYSFNNPMSSHLGSGIKAQNRTEEVLQLPTGYTCAPRSIEYSNSENKIYFPVNFGSLMGVAEYQL